MRVPHVLLDDVLVAGHPRPSVPRHVALKGALVRQHLAHGGRKGCIKTCSIQHGEPAVQAVVIRQPINCAYNRHRPAPDYLYELLGHVVRARRVLHRKDRAIVQAFGLHPRLKALRLAELASVKRGAVGTSVLLRAAWPVARAV